jgi:hypothetical protein
MNLCQDFAGAERRVWAGKGEPSSILMLNPAVNLDVSDVGFCSLWQEVNIIYPIFM